MSKEAEGSKLWGGRFDGKTDPIMEAFNASISYDQKMWKEDIQGSIAYSKALVLAGLLTREEGEQIASGLNLIGKEWEENKFIIQPHDEDIHTANERRLKELIGDVGGKVHTGRSRNDQVAVDTRLWLKNHMKNLATSLMELIQVLVERAELEKKILMPGYTHLQRAQPIRWSHFLLSHAWPLANDLERLKEVYVKVDVCPLGSGALAGNPFAVDRETLAKDLGFAKVSQNSLHAVSDRDFVVEYLFWCSLTSVHMSRLAEDLILYSTREFGFVTISDAYATGSSLMPQKKNPDSLELIRGRAGRMMGKLCGFLVVLKGLPSTYNKDLQEDKEALFEAASNIIGLLKVATGTVATLTIDATRCREALTEEMLSTDVAYYLVKKGMPFRSAHSKAGEVVKLSEDLSCSFSHLPLSKLKEISPLFSEDISAVWNFENSVEQYSATGGTALVSIQGQLQKMKTLLAAFELH